MFPGPRVYLGSGSLQDPPWGRLFPLGVLGSCWGRGRDMSGFSHSGKRAGWRYSSGLQAPELWEDPHPRVCSLLHPKDKNTAVSPPREDVQAGTGGFGPQVDRGTLSGTWPAEAAGKIRSGQPASSIIAFQLEDPRPGSLLAPWPAPRPQPSSQTQRSRDGAGSRAPVMLLILVRGGSLSMCTPSCSGPNKGGLTVFRLGCGLRTPEPQ